jgi:hypothetical protein
VAPGTEGAAPGGVAVAGGGEGNGGGGAEHAASTPRIAGHQRRRGNDCDMWVIVLEALGALVLLVLIVWWTMFAGRRRGERRTPEE